MEDNERKLEHARVLSQKIHDFEMQGVTIPAEVDEVWERATTFEMEEDGEWSLYWMNQALRLLERTMKEPV